MFQSIIKFFEITDVDGTWTLIIVGLLFFRCLFPYELTYKIKEFKKQNGEIEHHIYRIK